MEGLESRLLLSGNVLVSVANGDLKITGDSGDNQITIEQTGTGAYTIEGIGTTVQNATDPLQVTGAIRNIIIDMSKGGDRFEAVFKLGSAAVVDDDDGLDAQFQEIGDEFDELLAGFVSGDQNWYFTGRHESRSSHGAGGLALRPFQP